VQLPSRYILPSSVAHTSIAIEIAVAIERCYVVTYIFHGRYVLWIVGVIGVKVTVFLKTYVNVSYRALSRHRRIHACGGLPLAYRPSIPGLALDCAEDCCFLPVCVSFFLSILYWHVSFVCATWTAECSSRVRHRTDRGLHPWYLARSRLGESSRKRSYLPQETWLREITRRRNGDPYVCTTVYMGQQSTSDGITAFSLSLSHSLLWFWEDNSCKLHTHDITLVF